MPIQSEDFGDVINRAQKVTPADVGNPFTYMNQERNAAVVGGAMKAGGVPDLQYDARVKVFVLPTDAADYEEALDACLRGEAILRYEDRTFSKEGDFLVALCWLVPRVRPVAAVNEAAGDEEPALRPQRMP